RNPQAGRGGTPGTPEGSARGGGNGLLPPGSQGWQPGITAGRANPARGGGNGRQGGGQPAVARGGHLQVRAGAQGVPTPRPPGGGGGGGGGTTRSAGEAGGGTRQRHIQNRPPGAAVGRGLRFGPRDPARQLRSERGPVVDRHEPAVPLEPDRPPADLPPPDLAGPPVHPLDAHFARDALSARPPTQGPRDRCRVLYGHLSAVHRLFEVPVAPEPARTLPRLLPRLTNAVLVLLRGERAVLGEVHRAPARTGGCQALVPVAARTRRRVAAALLRVGVGNDVGPHLRQPPLEVQSGPDQPVGARTGTRDRGRPLRGTHQQVEVGGTPALELQLPDTRQLLAPGPLIALLERPQVLLHSLAVGRDGLPVPGVGQRDHGQRSDVAREQRAVVQLAQRADHVRPALARPPGDLAPRRRRLRPLGVFALGRGRVELSDHHVHELAFALLVCLERALLARAVGGTDRDRARSDLDMPSRTLAAVPARSAREHVGRVPDQVRRGERRPPGRRGTLRCSRRVTAV